MPIRRNKNTGETFEEPTRKIGSKRESRRQGGMEEKPTVGGAGDGHERKANNPDSFEKNSPGLRDIFSALEAPTQKAGSERHLHSEQGRTRLLRPQSESAEVADSDPMSDPVVGWLVAIAGPGKGQVCRLGYGINSLGRGDGSRVRLDFGDDRISRESHAVVTYDSRGRKFYLQHGGGTNLTYLDGEPVLVPTNLEPMMDFSIGETTLRFIPFCGPDFDWEDIEVG